MGNVEKEDGKRLIVEARLSCSVFPIQILRDVIQWSIDGSENGNPMEIEIVGKKTFLYLPHTLFRLAKEMSLYDKEAQGRLFRVVDPVLKNATHMIIREV